MKVSTTLLIPTIPGDNDTENNMYEKIMSDEAALAALIAEALMNDPRSEDAVIEVIHERGMITLQGQVDDVDAKEAAEEIAANYPGVISVTNELSVDPR
jgi:osmotically-inducible protein OsmY